jgi:hypothetical protein
MANSYENIAGSKFGNTGSQPYGLNMEKLGGFILLPQADSYAYKTYKDTDFATAIGGKTLLPKELRHYPYFNVVNCVDNTADNTKETTDYGVVLDIMHGKPSLTVTMDKRGIRQIQNIFKFEGNKGMSIMLYDKLETLYGKKTPSGTMKGWKVQISANTPKIATGSASMPYSVTFDILEEDAFLNSDRFAFYRFDRGFDLGGAVHGVHDVELSLVSAAATTLTIRAEIASTCQNMGDAYSTALAAAGAWIVKNRATGAAVVPAGVTYTAPNFVLAGLTTATEYDVSLNTPAALAALASPVGNSITGGFESNVLAATTA